jgi:hypothetical protein
MKSSGTRFAILCLLVTIGTGLMLIGITWLLFLGVALILLASSSFTQQHQIAGYRQMDFIFPGICAFVFLLLALIDGDAFVQQPRPRWFWILMSAVWFLAIAREFRRWSKNRSGADHSTTLNA